MWLSKRETVMTDESLPGNIMGLLTRATRLDPAVVRVLDNTDKAAGDVIAVTGKCHCANKFVRKEGIALLPVRCLFQLRQIF